MLHRDAGGVTQMRRYSLCAVVILCAIGPSARADIQLVDIFKNVVYHQTSGTAPTSPFDFFANVELTSQNAGDFNSVSVTNPGPTSPLSLPQLSPTFFGYVAGF